MVNRSRIEALLREKKRAFPMTENELNEIMEDVYLEGYSQGKIDQILEGSAQFTTEEASEPGKKREFFKNGKRLIFRATRL